jgi:uncharacterized protein YhbP (UPF0306 family)
VRRETLSGNIVDKACSGRVGKATNPQEAAAGHTKKCALSDNCKASGFGVYADGKFYEFDAKGAELAAEALTKSGKDKGAVFKVIGKVSGDKITVELDYRVRVTGRSVLLRSKRSKRAVGSLITSHRPVCISPDYTRFRTPR